MHKTGVLLCILFWALSPVFSLTITEVMTDPDSQSDFRLEWIELYNNSPDLLIMEDWTVNGSPFSMTLDAYSCGVIVRQAEGEGSFASVYGDRNGVWGDAPGEEYPCVEASFSLVNGGGSLAIADSSGVIAAERGYPADEGEAEDNTIRLYSEGFWEYGTKPGGTPGKAHLMIFLDFTDTAVKEGRLYREGEVICTKPCTGHWRASGLGAGFAYSLEISYNGDVLYRDTLLLREDHCRAVELALPDPSFVTFRFSDNAGAPLGQAEVTVVGAGTDIFTGVVEENTALELYPGDYGVYAYAEGFIGRYKEFTVAGPEEVSLSFPDPESVRISELAPFGAPEWVEVRSLSGGEVTLRGMSLGDNTGTGPLNAGRVHFADYMILTEDKRAFSSLWGEGLPVFEVPSFPSLNDTGDTVTLFLGEAVCDRVEYGSDWYSGDRPASFERIMPREPSGPENFYGTQTPSPGRVNRVDNMLNKERRALLREVSPFTEEEFVECLILDDGTEGRGALFFDYFLTDLDRETAFPKEIVFPGEVILFKDLSLSSQGDQACLLQRERVVDAFAWREKYKAMSPGEQEDFAFLREAGIDPFLFEEPDKTLSFQYSDGVWVLAGATPGSMDPVGENVSFYLPEAVSLEEGALPLAYSLDRMTEVEIFLFDTAGFRHSKKEVFLAGEGEIALPLPGKRGRYIILVSFRQGEKPGKIQKTVIVY
ncbi:MAG TPA: hypothetical protein PLV02_06650 [Candidatus Mcinerneyibacteriales bacterium]|nr:hypothetical protein [Candidatus Mcinerneyibacteriales bacterium]